MSSIYQEQGELLNCSPDLQLVYAGPVPAESEEEALLAKEWDERVGTAHDYYGIEEYRDRFFQGYDVVAERMGFTRNNDRNWELDVSPDQLPLAGITLAGGVIEDSRE